MDATPNLQDKPNPQDTPDIAAPGWYYPARALVSGAVVVVAALGDPVLLSLATFAFVLITAVLARAFERSTGIRVDSFTLSRWFVTNAIIVVLTVGSMFAAMALVGATGEAWIAWVLAAVVAAVTLFAGSALDQRERRSRARA